MSYKSSGNEQLTESRPRLARDSRKSLQTGEIAETFPAGSSVSQQRTSCETGLGLVPVSQSGDEFPELSPLIESGREYSVAHELAVKRRKTGRALVNSMRAHSLRSAKRWRDMSLRNGNPNAAEGCRSLMRHASLEWRRFSSARVFLAGGAPRAGAAGGVSS